MKTILATVAALALAFAGASATTAAPASPAPTLGLLGLRIVPASIALDEGQRSFGVTNLSTARLALDIVITTDEPTFVVDRASFRLQPGEYRKVTLTAIDKGSDGWLTVVGTPTIRPGGAVLSAIALKVGLQHRSAVEPAIPALEPAIAAIESNADSLGLLARLSGLLGLLWLLRRFHPRPPLPIRVSPANQRVDETASRTMNGYGRFTSHPERAAGADPEPRAQTDSIRVEIESIEEARGSVWLLVGRGDTGRRVLFGAHSRPAADILEALARGERPEAFVEPWQILRSDRVPA